MVFEMHFPIPKILMGDTGAIFFGLMLGVLTIYTGGKVATAFLVLGVPLIDSFFVITGRLLKGKNPLEGSQKGEHLHHRLLEKGWTPIHIILLTVTLGSAFGVIALFLSTMEKFIAALILFILMGLLHLYTRAHTDTT
jgi:UDP-GlcNAc:undecaprenyl-phosphate/decaprenyl-phosphate GlcNAc-1-phosphate transferase